MSAPQTTARLCTVAREAWSSSRVRPLEVQPPREREGEQTQWTQTYQYADRVRGGEYDLQKMESLDHKPAELVVYTALRMQDTSSWFIIFMYIYKMQGDTCSHALLPRRGGTKV